MPDKQKVIKAIETHLSTDDSVGCDDCTYENDGWCTTRVLSDALSLLKEQEAKIGKWIEQEDYNLDTYYDCSVCGESWSTVEGTPWENGMNYCPHCGARMESILCDNRTEGR